VIYAVNHRTQDSQQERTVLESTIQTTVRSRSITVNALSSVYHPLRKKKIVSTGKISRSLRSRSLSGHVRLGHSTIDDKIRAVDERALVGSQEEHGLSLLDGFSESTSREMNLTPVPLCRVVAEPVLEQRRVQRSRAQSVEAEPFTSVHDGELTRHCQNGAFGGCVGELWRRRAHESDDRGSVDDAAALLVVASEGEDGMLAAEPNALDVDVVSQVPDFLRGRDGIWMK
jgi:hypothetical protein